MYENTQNYAKALEWYRKAAEQGYAFAQSCLGVMYRDGKGVSKNFRKAKECFRKAVDQGDFSAQLQLVMSDFW